MVFLDAFATERKRRSARPLAYHVQAMRRSPPHHADDSVVALELQLASNGHWAGVGEIAGGTDLHYRSARNLQFERRQIAGVVPGNVEGRE